MSTLPMVKTNASIAERLKEIEGELKILQRQFADVKKRAKGAVQGERKRIDEKRASEILKKLQGN